MEPWPAGVYIVSGLPAAGKTTVARRLAQSLPYSAHIEADIFQRMIISGGVWPHEEPRDEAKRQLGLRGQHVQRLADSFAEGGFSPVIDDVVIGSRLDNFLAGITARPLFFVMLICRPEVLTERDAGRAPGKRAASMWHRLDEVVRLRTRHVGLWIDTSELSLEETMAQIEAGVADAKIA